MSQHECNVSSYKIVHVTYVQRISTSSFHPIFHPYPFYLVCSLQLRTRKVEGKIQTMNMSHLVSRALNCQPTPPRYNDSGA